MLSFKKNKILKKTTLIFGCMMVWYSYQTLWNIFLTVNGIQTISNLARGHQIQMLFYIVDFGQMNGMVSNVLIGYVFQTHIYILTKGSNIE